LKVPVRYIYFTEGNEPILKTVNDRTGESGSPKIGETLLISGRKWVVERTQTETKSERSKPLVVCHVFLEPVKKNA
jgi:hypothetical protein